MNDRINLLSEEFRALFGTEPTVYASAPGRAEIAGNHTDHQHGCTLAAAVDLRAHCVAALSGSDEIYVQSQGHKPCILSANDLLPREEERDHSISLVRGIAARLQARGVKVTGFYAYTTKDMPSGGGLSSSAAFEVMLAEAMCRLFGASLSPFELAALCHGAENDYYGKPSGLLDQLACAMGGAVALEFFNDRPIVSSFDFDPGAYGCSLVTVGCGKGHADLTDSFAAIPREMEAVAGQLGCSLLGQADEAEFYARLPRIRAAVGDRALLRAIHFFGENRRALLKAEAVGNRDFDRFLQLVRESGRSSWMYLQNIYPAGETVHQPMALALAMCDKLLGGQGAFRVHGGGFGGMLQAYVPHGLLPAFIEGMEALFGQGSCRVLKPGVRGCFSINLQ